MTTSTKELQVSHRIGIMQGRLSPVLGGKIQAFPTQTWREEFESASAIGYELIEWVVDKDSFDENPLHSESGRREILFLQRKYEIKIPSVCCDYFMQAPLTSPDESIRLASKNYLLRLIKLCHEVGMQYLELPLVAAAEVKTEEEQGLICEVLQETLPLLHECKMHVLLELSLEPSGVHDLLRRLNSDRFLVNYDTGNSAFWGFQANDEIPVYGSYVANVHIKDCTPEDYSVPLGTGNVDFKEVFMLLDKQGYKGDFILQAARGESDYQVAEDGFFFTQSLIKKFLRGS